MAEPPANEKRKRQLKEESQPPWYCLLSEVI
jgi:hypothetical protein